MLLTQFLKDDSNAYSCIRLSTLVIAAVVLGAWVWGMWRAGAYIPLGYGEVGLLSASSLAKAIQAKFEYENPSPYPGNHEAEHG